MGGWVGMSVCVCVCVRMCVCIYIYVCMHVCVCICMYTIYIDQYTRKSTQPSFEGWRLLSLWAVTGWFVVNAFPAGAGFTVTGSLHMSCETPG